MNKIIIGEELANNTSTMSAGDPAVIVDNGENMAQVGRSPSSCVNVWEYVPELGEGVKRKIARWTFKLGRIAGDTRVERNDFGDILTWKAYQEYSKVDRLHPDWTQEHRDAHVATMIECRGKDELRKLLAQKMRDAATIWLDEDVGECGDARDKVIDLEYNSATGSYCISEQNRMVDEIDARLRRDEFVRGGFGDLYDAVMCGASIEQMAKSGRFGSRRTFYESVWPAFKAWGASLLDGGGRPAA